SRYHGFRLRRRWFRARCLVVHDSFHRQDFRGSFQFYSGRQGSASSFALKWGRSPHFRGTDLAFGYTTVVLTMRSARFPLRFPVRYRRLGEPGWHQGVTQNISRSVVLFRVDELPPLEADLELCLELPAVGVPGHPAVLFPRRGLRTT